VPGATWRGKSRPRNRTLGQRILTGKGICFPQTPHLAQAEVPDQSFFPESFDEVKVGRVRRQEQQRDAQLSRQRLHYGVALIAGLVQNQKLIGVGSVFVVN